MSPHSGTVIVGGGQAAATCAEQLRRRGYEGDITIVCAEPVAPYRRPPLSKEYLKDISTDAANLLIKKPEWYAENRIRLLTDTCCIAIDTGGKTVSLESQGASSSLNYTSLVVATGSSNRKLPVAHPADASIASLRTIADAEEIRQMVGKGGRFVMLGGGYIGLEVASAVASQTTPVTVVELAERILQRVSSQQLASYITHQFRKRGVAVESSTCVTEIKDSASHLELLTDGEMQLSFFASHIVYGVGVAANDALAAEAGIACDGGVLIDRACKTSLADVYAIGDCAMHRDHLYAGRHRLESVPNAIETGTIAAAAITGSDIPEQTVPWFWSDQFDFKVQLLGLLKEGAQSDPEKIDLNEDSLALRHSLGGKLIAAEMVNASRQFLDLKRNWQTP